MRQLIAVKTQPQPFMTIRTRKFVGTLALLVLVVTWSLLAMAVAQFIFPATDSIMAWIYYVLVGIGWVLPAMPLVSWMQRPDPSP